MAEEKEYFVRVCGTSVSVTQEVYQTCYQTERHAKTLCEKDERHNLVSYDGMDTEETLGEECIADPVAISVEDTAIADIMLDKLHQCLALLSREDGELIYALYFQGLDERGYAALAGLSQSGINKRKQAILCKLRKMIES